MSNLKPLICIVVALVAGQARAACVGPPDVIEACQEVDTADAELNKAYRDLIEQLDSPPTGLEAHNAAAKKSLVTAQRSWLEFRDKDCLAVFNIADGTSRVALSASCEAEHDLLRAKQLRNMANGL
jgi:uncharacterized protein YecT (DUF1311 family)